jgi:hypothetical protein
MMRGLPPSAATEPMAIRNAYRSDAAVYDFPTGAAWKKILDALRIDAMGNHTAAARGISPGHLGCGVKHAVKGAFIDLPRRKKMLPP